MKFLLKSSEIQNLKPKGSEKNVNKGGNRKDSDAER